jgi:hypothetical protein
MSDDSINPFNKPIPSLCKYREVEWEYIGYGIHRAVFHECLVGCVWVVTPDQWRYRLDCNLIGQWSTEPSLELAKRRLFQAFCLKFFKRMPDEEDDTFSF